MRVLLVATLVLGLAGAATAAPAGSPIKTPQDAQKILKSRLAGAIKLEQNAIEQEKAGKHKLAKDEIENSLELLNDGLDAAQFMTVPATLEAAGAPKSPWHLFAYHYKGGIVYDEAALNATGSRFEQHVVDALRDKQIAYATVIKELKQPDDCSELINLQGPIKVNGVPQGDATLTIDWACKKEIKSIYVNLAGLVPKEIEVAPMNASAATRKHVEVINGVHSDGCRVTLTFSDIQAPVPGDQLDSEIVPIAGDSADYFPEVM